MAAPFPEDRGAQHLRGLTTWLLLTRELFRIQNLITDLRLRLRSLTLLFTDLKGSTALYDRTGDVFAYNLVH